MARHKITAIVVNPSGARAVTLDSAGELRLWPCIVTMCEEWLMARRKRRARRLYGAPGLLTA